jgi:hypothetical protein
MEDTVWPFEGKRDEYCERSRMHYGREMKQAAEHGPRLLTVDASFRTTLGAHRRREVILWQKVVQPEGMLRLLTHDLPAAYRKAGTWMVDALELRDQWQSRSCAAPAGRPFERDRAEVDAGAPLQRRAAALSAVVGERCGTTIAGPTTRRWWCASTCCPRDARGNGLAAPRDLQDAARAAGQRARRARHRGRGRRAVYRFLMINREPGNDQTGRVRLSRSATTVRGALR